MTNPPSLPSTGETARSEDVAVPRKLLNEIREAFTLPVLPKKIRSLISQIDAATISSALAAAPQEGIVVPRKWLEELAYFRVRDIRGSDDVPGFDSCVKAELNKMLQSLAAAPRPDAEYRCIGGHDKCNEMYPGPACPYCERKTTTPTGDVAAKLADVARDVLLTAWENCPRVHSMERNCDCDPALIDGCKAKVNAIADAIEIARKPYAERAAALIDELQVMKNALQNGNEARDNLVSALKIASDEKAALEQENERLKGIETAARVVDEECDPDDPKERPVATALLDLRRALGESHE